MRVSLMFLIMAALAACAPQDVGTVSNRARFTEYPEGLFAAFETACSGPAQSFSRLERGLIECREYLPPEPTAAIILGYDGTPEKLPQLVIRFQTTEERTDTDQPGYVVVNDMYLNVPQKTGPDLKVRQRDDRLMRMLSDLYRRAGGVPG
ncbi:hypothetical protein [Primorskyibacter sp. S87]|uniref:hypothetical protein n=1 Tax=Primorskyibacter sp. S87 TaxID=3415126 RepID=UPI003C7A7388